MTFRERLVQLGFASYEDYLAGPHWQDFRSAYRASGRSLRCAICHGKPIQLHHHTYARLGCEQVTDVTPLCREHHKAVHAWLKAKKRSVEKTRQAIESLHATATRSASIPKKTKKKRTPEQQAARLERRAKLREERDLRRKGSRAWKSPGKAIAKKETPVPQPSKRLLTVREKAAKLKAKRTAKVQRRAKLLEERRERAEELCNPQKPMYEIDPTTISLAAISTGLYLRDFAPPHRRKATKTERNLIHQYQEAEQRKLRSVNTMNT